MVVPLADSFLFRGGIQKEVLLGERWPSVWFVSRCVFIKKVSGRSRFIWLSPKNPEEFVEAILPLKQSVPSACPVEDSGSTRHLFSPSPKNLELPGRHGLFTSNQFLISARNASRCSTAQ